jgi:bifunctional N-acetylglucosamine-1-phosphate-uridyltransferase/glucosamine-1-phosphate-acetyltransferase GlmU-like protein
MLSGVFGRGPATTYVEAGVRVGQDTCSWPFRPWRAKRSWARTAWSGPGRISATPARRPGRGPGPLSSAAMSATNAASARLRTCARHATGARSKIGDFVETKNA